jgi:alanine racemase
MALLYFDYDIATIQSSDVIFPLKWLKVKTGINNCSLIDDSYSSDFQSLKIIDFLESQKQFKRRLFFRIYFKGLVQWGIIFQSFAIDYFQ